jgi:hypothetical protein
LPRALAAVRLVLMSTLAAHAQPDRIVIINDDTVAQAILDELGVTPKLRKHDALAIPCLAGVYVHVTHLVGYLWFRGYRRAGDNGLLLILAPRSLTSKDDMMAAIKRHLSLISAENAPAPVELE